MTNLSPAAQAVLDAFVSNAGEGHRHQSGAIAAALRAAALYCKRDKAILLSLADELDDDA